MFLINLYNQAGAGPKNISLNLISELKGLKGSNGKIFVIVPNIAEYKMLDSNESVSIIKLRRFNNILMTMIFRIYLDFVFIPKLVRTCKIQSMLAFGNYLLSPVKIKKVVLLHHPYLFDDGLLNKLPLIQRWIELLKRFIFWLTLKNVDTVVVQSPFVFEQFKNKWGGFKRNIEVIANPISKNFSNQSKCDIDRLVSTRVETLGVETVILYVSRFYPHKNHDFLIKLSSCLTYAGLRHKILITIDECLPGAAVYLQQIEIQKAAIFNLGEITQQELQHYYLNSHLFIFPSESETFGNPLVEAMSFGLPAIVPSLGYSRSILGASGIYYDENDVADCVKNIESLVQDTLHYRRKSCESYSQLDLYLASRIWAENYMKLISHL